jgi:dTDP-glucose pyrophosphorylase
MNLDTNRLFIDFNSSILIALKQMDSLGRKLLIVKDGGDNYVTLLSIGDIQRAILANTNLSVAIKEIVNADAKIVARESDGLEEIKDKMLSIRCEFMPRLSNENKIIDVIFWEDVFGNKVNQRQSTLNVPVVIMAGGTGSRLKPITNVLPKPLIPIGDKTIIEVIMDRFVNAGCNDFLVSVNYKADMIKYYFSSLNNPAYHIEYFEEEEPLGTAGSMFLLKEKIDSTFFVSNCDITIDQDLEEIFKYHKENGNVITIVSVLRHYKIPYGTIETGEGGVLEKLSEKPELTFQINSGLYILEPELLREIPENEFFHITDLIENVRQKNMRVGVFPVSEGSWKDIGEWSEYLKNYGLD